MANEKIEVGYRHIGTFAGVDYHHKFLLYTDKTGGQYTISGWTGEETTPQLPLGKIHIETGLPEHIGLPYDAENPDNINNRNAWYKDEYDNPISPQKQYRELIAQAPDLSTKWAEMVRNAQSKDNIYPYDFLRQNSNTLADTLLREAGFPEPEKDGIFRHLAPGSGNKLDKGIVPQHPDDAGISDLKDLSYLEEEKLKENPQYAMQTQAETVDNPKPQSKYEETMAMLQGLLNDTDGSYAQKVLAEHSEQVARFDEKVRQSMEEEQSKQQALADRESQIQQEAQQRGLSHSFG
ncbi:hypothetical protein BWD09_05385 [Neisseria dentiae]|uniref:Uncharacterized protein n=1 Tax=Neisseria dentiae TaxID=194197 RepID=A0A1X3DBX6_9NEIS|nr:hypothetical protein [Neisseria dentiae]OSI17428.1 hypothetical protein BWD09_05385 [Neisseria dentiae]QMT45820.1 hypothetical protein H3L92_03145 [Neisseria dentiae]STZ51802.1 Uncharacterised protein [Neisseria dentiae]